MLTRLTCPAINLCVVALVTVLSQGCRDARFELHKPKKDAPTEVKNDKPTAAPTEGKTETPTQTNPPVNNPLPPADDFIVNIPRSGYVNQCLPMEAACGADGMGRITFFYGDRYYDIGNQVKHAYSYIGRYQVTVRCDEFGKQPRFKSQYIDIICPYQ